jgi:hypothetical protein
MKSNARGLVLQNQIPVVFLDQTWVFMRLKIPSLLGSNDGGCTAKSMPLCFFTKRGFPWAVKAGGPTVFSLKGKFPQFFF